MRPPWPGAGAVIFKSLWGLNLFYGGRSKSLTRTSILKGCPVAPPSGGRHELLTPKSGAVRKAGGEEEADRWEGTGFSAFLALMPETSGRAECQYKLSPISASSLVHSACSHWIHHPETGRAGQRGPWLSVDL